MNLHLTMHEFIIRYSNDDFRVRNRDFCLNGTAISKNQQKILGHTPMNGYGSPEDIGWAAVYLSSKAASFVNGTSITVDGGCAIGF